MKTRLIKAMHLLETILVSLPDPKTTPLVLISETNRIYHDKIIITQDTVTYRIIIFAGLRFDKQDHSKTTTGSKNRNLPKAVTCWDNTQHI